VLVVFREQIKVSEKGVPKASVLSRPEAAIYFD
jgi:formylglycine-generating enzyme